MENLGMNILRENLGDILKDRNRGDSELLPKNNKDVILKGLKYAVMNGKIDRKRLDNYTLNYGIDSRHKIKILVSNEYENYYYIRGVLQYKNDVYTFYIMDDIVSIKNVLDKTE